MSFVIPAAERPTLPVQGGGEFPVRRIYCVGRNYADHALEMGSDPEREPPFFFSKPGDAVTSATEIPYPPLTENFHYEVELVLALKSGGADISPDAALSHVYGASVGLDLTRRDLQNAAKGTGRPWDMAKGFDYSAPIAPLIPGACPQEGAISLSVNGELKQSGDLSQMIWSNRELIANLSTYVTLQPGDLIMTGTPSGVGPIVVGDEIKAEIEGFSTLTLRLV